MIKRALLAGAIALSALATPASADHLDPDTYLSDFISIGWTRCSGRVDAACRDYSGAFCTVWYNFSCTVGE